MLQLVDPGLHPIPAAALVAYQDAVNTAGGYEKQVAEAKRLFANRNTKKNATFTAVRAALDAMCTGARRCGYCEDSAADEVEHIKPKDLYPEVVFEWRNYLYACGPCNGPKNNHFGVLVTTPVGAPAITDVSRAPKAPVVPPVAGPPAFLDPRHEDPLDFMMLDLFDTFRFVPTAAEGTVEWCRADYTISVLDLNDRDILPKARRAAYVTFRATLKEYIAERSTGVAPGALVHLVDAIRDSPHRTVWAEMQRQQAAIPALATLFTTAPEALTWLV